MKNEITQIINLEVSIRSQIEQLKTHYGIGELGVSISNPDHLEYLAKSREVSSVLFNYLQTLSDCDLLHLVTVMYAGRDSNMVLELGGFNEFHQFIQSQNFTNRDICIEKICEKEMNLATYYQNALNLAQQLNFDVDNDFI
ncbi:hypothetical protein [Vibrio parahaemolyticus]|uniref:hypothetical protein n=1 Tax=Vibrio parahaemolyticus TaxID=670 RepID=UPI00226A413D|nr:hypothetical protein [Vibrio parahaemolyticus]MCX8789063.1 hypothetical protein [Vibrio parahaemolyticus]MCX8850163.1 hypothetical protein [Vibrio parahaemolyticus]